MTPSSTEITVEPNMVERVIPGWYDGLLTAWSTSRDAACVMLGFMEGRKSASKGQAAVPSEDQLRAAVTEACAWFSGDHIERIVVEQLEREDRICREGDDA